MDVRNKLNYFIATSLLFVIFFNFYHGISACTCCLLVKWIFFVVLLLIQLTSVSMKFMHAVVMLLFVNFGISMHSFYSMIKNRESEVCKIGSASCFDSGILFGFPMQVWILIMCMISFFISLNFYIKKNNHES